MLKDIVETGERLFKERKKEINGKYARKTIAIDIETGSICGVGDTLTEAAREAHRKYPQKKFYFKKIGSPYTAHVLSEFYARVPL